jgi:hypothetical protein
MILKIEFTSLEIEEITRLYADEDWPTWRIAEKFDVSSSTVYKVLRSRGIARRGHVDRLRYYARAFEVAESLTAPNFYTTSRRNIRRTSRNRPQMGSTGETRSEIHSTRGMPVPGERGKRNSRPIRRLTRIAANRICWPHSGEVDAETRSSVSTTRCARSRSTGCKDRERLGWRRDRIVSAREARGTKGME